MSLIYDYFETEFTCKNALSVLGIFEHDEQKIRISVFTLSKICSKFDGVIMSTCKKIKKKQLKKEI